jgi:hypothetical protein
MTVAPTAASTSRRTAASISPSGPSSAIHTWRRSPPSPIGAASRTFGPAVNPSRDIDTSSTTLPIANLLHTIGAAVQRRHEIVGARPAVSTSPLKGCRIRRGVRLSTRPRRPGLMKHGQVAPWTRSVTPTTTPHRELFRRSGVRATRPMPVHHAHPCPHRRVRLPTEARAFERQRRDPAGQGAAARARAYHRSGRASLCRCPGADCEVPTAIHGTVSFTRSLMAQSVQVAHPTRPSRRGDSRSGTMKAIVQDRYGSADVLALTDIAAPVVGDDDVLVRVHAAGCGIPKPARLPHRAGRGRSHLQCHRPPGPPRQSRVRPEQKVLIIGAAGGVGHGPGASSGESSGPPCCPCLWVRSCAG